MEDLQVLALTSTAIGILLTLLVICLKVGEWKGSVDKDRQKFNQFITEMREKIDDIFNRLPSRRLLEEQKPTPFDRFRTRNRARNRRKRVGREHGRSFKNGS